MGRRRSNDITKTRPPSAGTGITSQPAPSTSTRPASTWGFVYFIGGVGLLLAVSLLVLAWMNASHEEPKEPEREEDRICQEFIRKHNAGDPTAADLLGRVPTVPEGVITEAEAQRLDTDFFLRDSGWQIVRMRKEGAGHYTFVTNGYISGPKYPQVRYDTGAISIWQRARLDTPDLQVEVRDGKIFGIHAGLCHD